MTAHAETPPRRFTAAELEDLMLAALRAGDVDAVVACLYAMAPIDPHRAGLLYDTLKLGITLAQLTPRSEENPMPDQAPTATERRRTAADQLNAGGPITAQHAILLARSLLTIVHLGAATTEDPDSRILLARAVLARADADLAAPGPLDDYAQDILHRCRLAKHHGGLGEYGSWSQREQLAVALVLSDRWYLAQVGFTVIEAAQYVADGMVPPPADMRIWVQQLRDELAKEENG